MVVAEVAKLVGISIRCIVAVTMVAPAVEIAVQVALLGVVVVGIVPCAVPVAGAVKAVGVIELRVATADAPQVVLASVWQAVLIVAGHTGVVVYLVGGVVKILH